MSPTGLVVWSVRAGDGLLARATPSGSMPFKNPGSNPPSAFFCFQRLPPREERLKLGRDFRVSGVQGLQVDAAILVGGGVGKAASQLALLFFERFYAAGQFLQLARFLTCRAPALVGTRPAIRGLGLGTRHAF